MKELRFLLCLLLGGLAAACSQANPQNSSVPKSTEVVASTRVTSTPQIKPAGERHVLVLGQVGNPGWVIIPPEKSMTLVTAITFAHGPMARANHLVKITRKMPDGTTKEFEQVDLLAAMKGTGPDFPLENGDTITVFDARTGNNYQ